MSRKYQKGQVKVT